MAFIDPEEKEIGLSPLPKKGLDNLAKCEFLSTEPISNPCHGFSISETHTNNSVYGASDGSINITVNGGKSPYSYSWSNGATTQDIGSLAAGTYSVTVTDDNQCEASISVEITQAAYVPSYNNCFSSYLPIDSEGRIYAIQVFESWRQDLAGGFRMLGAGAPATNVNKFGNGETGGGIPFGIDDTRSNKTYSPIVSYGSGYGEIRSYYVLLKDSSVSGAENAPYSFENPIAGGVESVGIPDVRNFMVAQPHGFFNVHSNSNPGLRAMLIPPGWRVAVYSGSNYSSCSFDGSQTPTKRYELNGPMYLHADETLPYIDTYSSPCADWGFMSSIGNTPVSVYPGDREARGEMSYWHKRCAVYTEPDGGYSMTFTKIPL